MSKTILPTEIIPADAIVAHRETPAQLWDWWGAFWLAFSFVMWGIGLIQKG